VVPIESFISKIRAAVQARRNRDFVLVARTDARAVLGLDEAIARADAALQAGADMAFVEATQSLEEAAIVPRRVRGPCLLNVVPGGKTPVFDLRQAEEMGYKLAILPGMMLKACLEAGDAALAELKATQRVPEISTTVAQTFRRFGADEWNALRRRFDQGAGDGTQSRGGA